MLGLTMTDIVIMTLGIVSLIIWLMFFIKGMKYNSMFDVLVEKEYPFKEIYGLGYAVLETIKYNYKSKGDRKLRQELDVLYGSKYSEYYLRTIHSQQITIAFTLFVLSFILYGLASDVLALIVGFVFAGLAYYYFGTVTKKRILKRSDELLHDFSEVVSKLALLTNAGMILREGMTKGNSELTAMLQEQSKEVWQLKKQLVRREGEKAASKLLIPICVMFVGILIMIIVPIFTNLGV